MVYATYTVGIDWNADGDFSDSNETVTSRTIEQATASYGRDQARAYSPPAAGVANVTLNNRSRDYYPDNGSSPIGSNLKPGRELKIEATYASTTYGIARGWIEDFTIQPGTSEQLVRFAVSDALARLQGVAVSSALYRGIRTGEAVHAVLDAANWTGGRDIDPGATYMPYWWLEGTDALNALKQLVASEGSPALVYVDPGTGDFVFRDRHHRLLYPASLTSQATFRSAGVEPRFSEPVSYTAGWRDVINDVELLVEERQQAGELDTVWSSDDILALSASAAVDLHVQGNDPFTGAVVPAAGVDYTVISGAVASVALSRDNGQSTTITITADSGGAILTGLQLRAYPISVVRARKVTARDPDSITEYGSRGLPDELRPVWANRYDAQAIIDLAVQQRAQRLPILTLTMKGHGHPSRLVQCLARQLSDRVTVVDARTGINTDFYVEQIAHEIEASQGGRWHTTTFGLEQAPAAQTGNVFAFDVSGSGFNDGIFGTGMDDPDTIFILDGGAGHRFDEGQFAR